MERDNASLFLVAVGGLMVDVYADIGAVEFGSGDWVGENAPVSVDVGGTPTHICAGTNTVPGWRTLLVAAIGAHGDTDHGAAPDLLGDLALKRLHDKGIEHRCELVPRYRTGCTVLLYPPSDGRLMIADTVTSATVSFDHLTNVLTQTRAEAGRTVVYLSGYLHFGPEAASPAAAARAAIGPDDLLWVDVVPHDLYRRMSLAEFARRVEAVDLISIDRATMDQFAAGAPDGATSFEDAVLANGTSIAVVDANVIRIRGPLGDGVVLALEPDVVGLGVDDLDRTPGGRDRMMAVALAGHLSARLADPVTMVGVDR